VTVASADGASAATSADQYSYLSALACAAAPSITTQPSGQT
jgi:hypothetical protein